MTYKVKKSCFFIMMLVIVFTFSSLVSANEQEKRFIDQIVVKVDDKIDVAINTSEYMQALRRKERSNLYMYLKGLNVVPPVIAFSSGNKYMGTIDYMKALRQNNNDTSKAIEAATELSIEVVDAFLKFNGFNDEGIPILIPVNPMNISLRDLGGTITEFANIYSIELDFNKVKKVFSEVTVDSIIMLELDDKTNIELIYNLEDDSFVIDGLQGINYTREKLENATVKVKYKELPERFRVIDIY